MTARPVTVLVRLTQPPFDVRRVPPGVAAQLVADGLAEYVKDGPETAMRQPSRNAMRPRGKARQDNTKG